MCMMTVRMHVALPAATQARIHWTAPRKPCSRRKLSQHRSQRVPHSTACSSSFLCLSAGRDHLAFLPSSRHLPAAHQRICSILTVCCHNSQTALPQKTAWSWTVPDGTKDARPQTYQLVLPNCQPRALLHSQDMAHVANNTSVQPLTCQARLTTALTAKHNAKHN